MNDEDRRGKSQDSNRSGPMVWLLLSFIVVAIFAAAYFVSHSARVVRYPELKDLLRVTKYQNKEEDALVSGKESRILTTEAKTDRHVEISRPQQILIYEDAIRGKVQWKYVGSSEPAKTVDFETLRDTRQDADPELIQLLNDSNVIWDHAPTNRFFEEHAVLLAVVATIVILTIYVVRKVGGVGGPMAFARSRGRLYAQEDLPTTFDDVAGIDEAVEEVREIVDFLKTPEKYQRLGGRIPKGVLLVGPPGTGKTLLAKAIAGEAGVPFFSLSGSDFVEMFVGVGAARVRDMFHQAASRAPCIIFIDELDALGKSRTGAIAGGHDEREQTLNALLVEMDGFDSNTSVIVIGATNRPETLDPALLRPGRFDRHVLVDRPDVRGREQILKVHVKNVKLDPNVDLKSVASLTSGFVGADLANLVNEAALLAARGDKSAVSIVEFNEAVERVTAGLEKKKRVMDQEEKTRVAYHEAGHALVAYSLPNTDPVHKVSIIPRGLAALGYTMQRPLFDRHLMTKTELESQIKVLLAGTLTEEMVFADISTGAQNDLERATHIARSMVMEFGMSRMGRVNFRQSNRSAFLAGGGEAPEYSRLHSEQTAREIDEEVRRLVQEALEQTSEILRQRRDALEAITRRLLEVESIEGEELREIIETHLTGPRVVPGTTAATPRAKPSATNGGIDIAPTSENQM